MAEPTNATDATSDADQADEHVLHRWQSRLLTLLHRGETPAAIKAALLADPELRPLHAYTAGLDPHALVVAAELVAKWAPRYDEAP